MNEFTSTAINVDLWANHFKLMAQGKIRPNKHQVFIVNKTASQTVASAAEKPVQLKMVTPAAQAVEIATSDIKNAEAAPTDSDPISHFPSEHPAKIQPVKKAVKKRKPAKSLENKDSTTESKKKKTVKTPKQWQQYLN